MHGIAAMMMVFGFYLFFIPPLIYTGSLIQKQKKTNQKVFILQSFPDTFVKVRFDQMHAISDKHIQKVFKGGYIMGLCYVSIKHTVYIYL